MLAKKAKTEKNLDKCGKCGKLKDLTQHTKADGDICEDCYLEKFQIEIPIDEYSLQPDELTKEQFAEKAGVSLRNIEIWKKAGKIEAQKLRRRVNDVVRSQLIFKTAYVENFLNSANEAVNLPKVENNQLQKTNEAESDLITNSQMFVLEKTAEIMNNFSQNLQKTLLPPVTNEKPFLNIKEAADEFSLSESCLRQLVKDDALTKFTGKHGETLISRKQLLNL